MSNQKLKVTTDSKEGRLAPAHENMRIAIMTILIIAYAVAPFAYYIYLLELLEAGAFPPHADSIGIPMFGFILIWILGGLSIGLAAVLVGVFRRFWNKRLP